MAKKKAAAGGAKGPAKAEPARSPAPVPRRDLRRYIYAALDFVFAAIYLVVVTQLTLTQSMLDRFQLMMLPVCAGFMGAGMLVAGRVGWWMTVAGCGAILLSAVLLIARIVVSISFLSGVYGGFGKAATSFALLAIALIAELVVLLPLFQLKYVMSRAGRRTLRVAPPLAARATT